MGTPPWGPGKDSQKPMGSSALENDVGYTHRPPPALGSSTQLLLLPSSDHQNLSGIMPLRHFLPGYHSWFHLDHRNALYCRNQRGAAPNCAAWHIDSSTQNNGETAEALQILSPVSVPLPRNWKVNLHWKVPSLHQEVERWPYHERQEIQAQRSLDEQTHDCHLLIY